MGGVLRAFWRQFAGSSTPPPKRMHRRHPVVTRAAESGAVFVVLRRLRAPLITLILVFAVSVIGLSLVPGQDANGAPARMSVFDAFYFMSYTATTIGFGELPDEFTYAQRMWVTGAIYLTVVGWAYAIGAVLTLLQDRAFRRALTRGHVTRKVARLREPFLLVAGYGQTGEMLGKSFDALGRRFTVVDKDEARIDVLELNTSHADVPGLVGDARDLHALVVAGLDHPWCEGVVALTNDDQANLAVTMAAALLRPELPVVARTTSVVIADRMAAFGSPTVINPFDRFGDRLRLALRAPSSYQLTTWLESGPGAALPERRDAPAPGRWVVAGYGAFGRHFSGDLRAEGLDVATIDPDPVEGEPPTVEGDASDPDVLRAAGLVGAVGFVAGTDDDITNMSLVAEARRVAPGVFVAARQNDPTSGPLFAALEVDALLVPTAVVAHEAYAQLSTPLLWRFLRGLLERDDAWAAEGDRTAGRAVRLPPGPVVEGAARRRRGALAARLAGGRPAAVGRPAAQPGGPGAPAGGGPARPEAGRVVRRAPARARGRRRAAARRRAAVRRPARRAPRADRDAAGRRHAGVPGQQAAGGLGLAVAQAQP